MNDEGVVALRSRLSGGRLQTASCCVGVKTVVVSDEEKALLEASGGDQEDERE